MNVRDFARTNFYAFTTAHAFPYVDSYGTCLRVNFKGFERANSNTRVVLALCAKMRKFCSWNKHKHANSRGFRPNLFFLFQGTCYLAFSATAAFREFPAYPN